MSIRAQLWAHKAVVASLAVAFALVWLGTAPRAQATAFGELGQVGEFGSGAGQFDYPSDLAVDSSDNSVYVLDAPGASERIPGLGGFGVASYRVQKFASTLGAPVASLNISTPAISKHTQFIASIAVDPVLHRLYVLRVIEARSTPLFGATEIEAYSTETSAPGEKLKPAAGVEFNSKPGVLYEFPAVPSSGSIPAGAVAEPRGLAVDPDTHDLLVLGGDGPTTKHTLIQQIAMTAPDYSSGTSGEAFDDTAGKLAESGQATGIAVASQGFVYVTSKHLKLEGLGPRGIARLSIESPNTLANPAIVQVVTDSSSEAGKLTGGFENNGWNDAGAQVAVSTDGKVVYSTQVSQEQEPQSLAGEGSYEIRGVSTEPSTLGSRQVVFGAGTAPTCHISSVANAVAAGAGGVVYALDEGEVALVGEEGEEEFTNSEYGFRLIKFGSGGSGCPTPSSTFKIDGTPIGTTVTVHTGEEVTFDGSESQLNGTEPVEVRWDLDNSEKYATVVSGKPASLIEKAKFLTPGTYKIGMKIVLKEGGEFGDPPPVSGTLVVDAQEVTLGVSKGGSGSGTVQCSTDAGITFGACASKYLEGTKLVLKETPSLGSEFVNWNTASGSAMSCEGSSTNECMFTISSNSALTATFNRKEYGLTIGTTGGTGTGTVECEVQGSGTSGSCASTYPEGTSVKITAKEQAGSTFESWSGECSSINGEVCTVDMTASRSVAAKFAHIPGQDALVIDTSGGSGAGSIECEVNAGGTFGACAASYAEGSKLVLKAVAGSHSTFAGWDPVSGSAGSCAGTGTCSFTIEADTTVDAPFSFNERTLTVTPSGEGAVSASTGAISNCSVGVGTCSGKYPEGKTVTLAATPVLHHKTKWGLGQCQSEPTANECVVAIGSGDVAVTVSFPLEEFTLAVAKAGGGTGTVTCNGGGCAASYPYNTQIELVDKEASGSKFEGWSAGTGSAASCASTSPCTFKITANSTVTATNALMRTITVVPTGEGAISAGTGAISNCSASGGTCSGEYAEGETVALTATPQPFGQVNWTSGCTTSAGDTCKVTVANSNATVDAAFSKITHTLTVVAAAGGSVSAGAGPISSCTVTGGVCSGAYPEGEPITLTASPAPGFSFGGWGGGGCTGTGTCVISSLAANVTVHATFALVPQPGTHTLTVNRNGTGSGTVTSAPAGIACGVACSATFEEGSKVRLTATPASGSTFTGWTGGGCSGTGECVLAVGSNTTVTATFAASAPAPATEGKLTVPGSATVIGGKASLKLTCSSAGSCHGTLKLTTKTKHGHRTKSVTIGQVSYSMAAGKSETVTVKLSKAAANLLKADRTVHAQFAGGDVKGTVKLTLGKSKK